MLASNLVCDHIAAWDMYAEGISIELDKCYMLNMTITMTIRLCAAERKFT